MSGSDLLRYLVLSIVACVGIFFGLKLWAKQKAEKQIVRELRAVLNPATQFEQLYAPDAEADLFRSMAALHRGMDRLDREPGAILKEVFQGKGEAALFPNRHPEQDRYYTDPRETLIRESLLRNFQRCTNLGVFESANNLRRLDQGEPPEIRAGPATGLDATVGHIIDPSLLAGAEKLIPNMLIGEPRRRDARTVLSDLEIKQAITLATLLHRAKLIESSAEKRLLDHYDALESPSEPAPAPR